ncbi:ERG7, lanosterol synthase [Piedraia hortae CBS 480.64]|uniref:Terpene cyclase/mutase family member n=1 Tax=Piedraia hortae CBS 480.64 TaxID=1314780 RepID=A0A6A7BU27_9PEZI|nr:ERG7, lanosterol synthase [Piedraia hortae CBS 480.64]
MASDPKTDHTRWRLKDDDGRQTWHYLTSEAELRQWPATTADKYFLGLDTGLPNLKPAQTPLESADNGLKFFSQLQLEPGNWACEYGGPMFLLPGLIITLYVTNMPLSQPEQTEIIRYLFNMQNVGDKKGGDGGWGLHVEGDSSVFGTAMNYTALRLLGVDAEDARMKQVRSTLYSLGSALNGPHWAKFWLSVLGVMDWDVVNPVPPELWLLPDWMPIAPWRWWIHMRQVFLPMGYIWSKRWSYPRADSDPLIRELRRELFTSPHEDIAWAKYRNAIGSRDNYHPKSWILNLINAFLVWIWVPYLRSGWLVRRAEEWVWKLIQMEDANTDYADLAPVNAPMNTLACYITEGPDSYSVKRHRERLQDYLWLSKDGMMMNGTNGVQNWDTAFAIQAMVSSGLVTKPEYQPVALKALHFLASQQILEHPAGYVESSAYSEPPTPRTCSTAGYRHPRRGAWGFSTRTQGYTVSDCTAEALKSVLLLQTLPSPANPSKPLFPEVIPLHRLQWAVDVILTMQNPQSGGCCSYEPQRGSEYLEVLNAAEVFGRIMVEYDYPECTTACATALHLFNSLYPAYRPKEVHKFLANAKRYILSSQRPDGSWYGSWGICFTYATMFSLHTLSTLPQTPSDKSAIQKGCTFLLSHQNPDGGWGESYRSCETGTYTPHPGGSQVVQTAWAVIALIEAKYPDLKPLRKAVGLIRERQRPNGEWVQEGIEGVFNKSCMISYPNYKFIFPIMALGMFEGFERECGGGGGG